ncbi:MAG TPA: hypothetical protein VEX60_13535 [Pyrinomonadaceae bacterium]|nr:hypothetical protein [Pyrinomonadaceae bacterium]
MSKNNIVRYLVVLLFAVFTSAVFVFADFGALAQNANSSTTEDASVQNENTTPPRRGRRRGRRRAAVRAVDIAVDTGATSPGEQTDLSGTYTGHVTMTGGHEMETDGTLTITGNQFSLEGGGMTHSGRIYAVTTRGYTGVSMYFSDMTDSATNTPVVAMGRARKRGDRLSITRVPGARTTITFR